ncbi:inositol polyphosphate multikinase isoform X2 [Monodelphis domestica]|uniref:inositol polyphosphate multikinase isoform X2 n=1 Tax=Monodelphis domestica TaxID=13616 RepID=UPI0024E1F43E|nr:inositol polyphosphate multikinase isoform X2 [Monodelphis domestica]
MATEPPAPRPRLPGPAPASPATPAGAPPAAPQPALPGSPSPPPPPLLNGCVPLSHQVAGHMYGKDKVGILQHPDGTVLKQLQPPPRGPRELEFYNTVYAADCGDSVLLELRKYLPKYYGIWSPPTAPNDLYLKLEDVTHTFNKPCIMDVKIGRKSYDPFASSEKIQQQVSKYPLMEEIGFLVLGMRVYHAHSDSYETQNQHYGRSLTKETIQDGVSRFFHNGYCLRKDAIAASIKKIEKILQWFESQSQLNFYASSLLFVYEGSSLPTANRLGDGTSAEKAFWSKGQLPEAEVLEYNNNIHLLSSKENGKVGASVGKVYVHHKEAYSKNHHGQTPLKVENGEQGNVWKSSNCISQEHLNGNVLSQLEKVFYHRPAEPPESSLVEVRMIDFAHVFPSNTKDEGYVYGLKHLITVLQNILDN